MIGCEMGVEKEREKGKRKKEKKKEVKMWYLMSNVIEKGKKKDNERRKTVIGILLRFSNTQHTGTG